MNELQAIIKACEEAKQRGEEAFLATIVNTRGSTYRRPGARMLMTKGGQMVGTISGGCWENDVLEYARQRLVEGQSLVVTYDTTAKEDIVWGFGLGCNGVVQVLLETLDLDNSLNPITFLAKCCNHQQESVLATVFGIEGEVNVKLGARLALLRDSSKGECPFATTTNIPESKLIEAIIKDAKNVLFRQQSSTKKYQLRSGSAEVFLEFIQPPTPLIIFGAGRDVVPLANLAETLGWHVTVVDCRAAETTFERFPLVERVILARREIISQQVCVAPNSVAVVMTHNYLDDREILKMLLPSPLGYLGILGPKQRTERLLDDLRSEKLVDYRQYLPKLYAPVGLDIGAETAEEIALAIVAEIKAVIAERKGSFLKERRSSIH